MIKQISQDSFVNPKRNFASLGAANNSSLAHSLAEARE